MPEGQKAGPKGRQLEVGAQRAPRLLVVSYLVIRSNRISCVFVFLTVQNIIFDVLVSLAFQKYEYVGYFRHFLTSCICAELQKRANRANQLVLIFSGRC